MANLEGERWGPAQAHIGLFKKKTCHFVFSNILKSWRPILKRFFVLNSQFNFLSTNITLNYVSQKLCRGRPSKVEDRKMKVNIHATRDFSSQNLIDGN